MTIRLFCVFTMILTMPALALGEEHASWVDYMKANRYSCPGPFDSLKAPLLFEMGGKRYELSGHQLKVLNPDADKRIKIGAIGASKDAADGTMANIKASLAWFEKQGVEWIVANGDLAMDEFDFEEIIDVLAQSKLPVLVVLGNADSRGSWARIYRSRFEKYPNLIDGTLVRQILADDVELWTLPGYHNKAFVKQTGACTYSAKDVMGMRTKLKKASGDPVALISHGPPQGRGRRALDWIPDKVNVGDPDISALLKKKKIAFGVFGHILEAGGIGVGADFSSRVKPGARSDSLYVNVGSVSGDPWPMLDGSASYGMAMIIEMDGGFARYRVKRFKSRF